MQLKTRVKVSEVTNLSDARYSAGMGVEYIGFNLDKNEDRSVDDTNFTAITQWLEGVTIVGEFKSNDSSKIIAAIEKHELKTVEISNLELLGDLPDGLKIFLRLDSKFDLEQIDEVCDQLHGEVEAFIIDSPLSWDSLSKLSKTYPILTGQNITSDSIEENISKTSLFGIELKGGDEERPGFKSFDELADILEILEVEDY